MQNSYAYNAAVLQRKLCKCRLVRYLELDVQMLVRSEGDINRTIIDEKAKKKRLQNKVRPATIQWSQRGQTYIPHIGSSPQIKILWL